MNAPDSIDAALGVEDLRAALLSYTRQAYALLPAMVQSRFLDIGKWFAAAKSAGLYAEAIELVHRSPCDPRTLIRAARDLAWEEPRFAMEAGLAALRWLAEGYGYEITALDVRAAYDCAMKAAEIAGCSAEAAAKIRRLLAGEAAGTRFIRQILGRELRSG